MFLFYVRSKFLLTNINFQALDAPTKTLYNIIATGLREETLKFMKI